MSGSTSPARSACARWGTSITTPSVDDASASVNVRAEIANATEAAASVTVETAIVDADGAEVVRGTPMPATAEAGSSVFVESTLTVPHPVRWDLARPYLYRAVTVVRSGRTSLDRYVTAFGVRTIAFNKATGFSLNGRHVKFQGVCLHHDLGALGAAINHRALERQLQIMKAMGVNAIRTSHNPPAPELLDLADRWACSSWTKPSTCGTRRRSRTDTASISRSGATATCAT